MDLNDYQRQAMRTWQDDLPYVEAKAMAAMGLSGEAGEVCDLLKKFLFHDHELTTNELIDELGDVLWYLAAVAHSFDIPLELVAKRNVAKLRERYPDGFDAERSKNRP